MHNYVHSNLYEFICQRKQSVIPLLQLILLFQSDYLPTKNKKIDEVNNLWKSKENS